MKCDEGFNSVLSVHEAGHSESFRKRCAGNADYG